MDKLDERYGFREKVKIYVLNEIMQYNNTSNIFCWFPENFSIPKRDFLLLFLQHVQYYMACRCFQHINFRKTISLGALNKNNIYHVKVHSMWWTSTKMQGIIKQ